VPGLLGLAGCLGSSVTAAATFRHPITGLSTDVDHLGDAVDNERASSVDDAPIVWNQCRDLLRPQVSDAAWISTFSDARAVSSNGDLLELVVPSVMVKDKIERSYLTLLSDVIRAVAGADLGFAISVSPQRNGPLTVADPLDEQLGPRTGRAENPAVPSGMGAGTGDPSSRYTFDAFVTGPSNRFAQAAALRVAETPGQSYNPLFMYGNAGLGKTHLLRAIGSYVQDNYPGRQVRYVASEKFLNEFVDSIRLGTNDQFKRRYREVHVLLVDDIQFIEGRKETQEEFFHTFNSLYEQGRQIVLSSDRHPDAIATLDARLRTRFNSGLTVDIQPPDLETRLAILRKKADQDPIEIPSEVLELIARNVTNNIRELEGALIRVSAFANLTGQHLDMEMAEKVLSDILTDRQPRVITVADILAATSNMFSIPVEDLTGPSRQRPLVNARQIAMYVSRELTDLSYPALAREFGGRDHTTVIHAVNKVTGQMKDRRPLYDQVTELIQGLRSL